MISASEAKELYVAPPYTEEEIEAQIRERATVANYTCFEPDRMDGRILDALRELGYKVSVNSTDCIVNW